MEGQYKNKTTIKQNSGGRSNNKCFVFFVSIIYCWECYSENRKVQMLTQKIDSFAVIKSFKMPNISEKLI